MDNKLIEEEKELKRSLKQLPFETILKLKKQDNEQNLDWKKQAVNQARSQSEDGGLREKKKKKKSDAPIERNAKIPVSRYSKVFNEQKSKPRDPRFDGLSGKFNQDLFQKTYTFIDEMKNNELKVLSKDISKKKYTQEQKQILREKIGQIKGELKLKENSKKQQEIKRQFKQNALNAIKDGKNPHFAKKSEIKQAKYLQEFKEHDKKGTLDKFMNKKREQRAVKLDKAMHEINYNQYKKRKMNPE